MSAVAVSPQSTSWPLTADHLVMLNSIIDNHPLISEVLAKCKDCGVACDEQIATLNEQLRLARAFKAKFFPNEP